MIGDALLPPWVLAYAEWGTQRLALIDHVAAGCVPDPQLYRYTVSELGPPVKGTQWPCQAIGRLSEGARDLFFTYDEAEAMRVFREHADRLAEGEP